MGEREEKRFILIFPSSIMFYVSLDNRTFGWNEDRGRPTLVKEGQGVAYTYGHDERKIQVKGRSRLHFFDFLMR